MPRSDGDGDVVVHLLNQVLVTSLRPMRHSALNLFKEILLHDGTSFAIHEGLANVFPGRYPAKNRAAVEVHADLDPRLIRVAFERGFARRMRPSPNRWPS